jgi:hypothetical protein
VAQLAQLAKPERAKQTDNAEAVAAIKPKAKSAVPLPRGHRRIDQALAAAKKNKTACYSRPKPRLARELAQAAKMKEAAN